MSVQYVFVFEMVDEELWYVWLGLLVESDLEKIMINIIFYIFFFYKIDF